LDENKFSENVLLKARKVEIISVNATFIQHISRSKWSNRFVLFWLQISLHYD
jgi:hypothetical protein